jgi:hypothetical protein
MDILKLHVEVGANKFDGEGPADLIKELYQGFLAKLDQAQPPALAPKPLPAHIFRDNPPPGAMEALYKKVFVEKDGLVSLQVLPKSEDADGDALILLLHGYQKEKPSEYPVTAVRLMQVAKLSGVNIERLDRALNSKSALTMKSGFKRSTKYSLNNRGEAQAMEILKGLFD